MKRSTRSFATGAVGRLQAMQAQQARRKNEATAKTFGYKYPACLVCGNHDTKMCTSCEIEEPSE